MNKRMFYSIVSELLTIVIVYYSCLTEKFIDVTGLARERISSTDMVSIIILIGLGIAILMIPWVNVFVALVVILYVCGKNAKIKNPFSNFIKRRSHDQNQ